MTSRELTITPFNPEHQTAARRLILEGLGEHWGWIDEEINTDLVDIATSYAGAHFVLGWLDGDLVATGALIAEDAESRRVVRMSVAKASRRRGFGARILDHLVDIARQSGVKRVVLETTETWLDVIAFYEAYGFGIDARRNGDTHMSLDLEDRTAL